jgi:hypothetical protein
MTIRKCKPSDRDPDRPASEQVWCLFSKDDEKLLGRHPTKEKAEKQERAVQIQKARSKGHRIPKKALSEAKANSDLDKDAERLSQALNAADKGRGTAHVYTQVANFGVIVVEYSGLPDTARNVSFAWRNNPHFLITVGGYDKDGQRSQEADVRLVTSSPKGVFKAMKGDHEEVLSAVAKQISRAVGMVQASVARAKPKTSTAQYSVLRKAATALLELSKER